MRELIGRRYYDRDVGYCNGTKRSEVMDKW